MQERVLAHEDRCVEAGMCLHPAGVVDNKAWLAEPPRPPVRREVATASNSAFRSPRLGDEPQAVACEGEPAVPDSAEDPAAAP